jgi:uncharacterized protein YqgC (DUF456 family)
MPFNFFGNPAAPLTLLLMLLGLVGAGVPVIPGPPLIWLGALAWAMGEGFQRMDWLTLAVLGILALLATFSEYWLAPITQRRAGYGWKDIFAAFIGGIAGGILLSELPVVGTLFGAALGSVVAVSALTFWERKNFRHAARAAQTYLVGCALSSAVEVVFSLVMVGIFAWRAFF